MVFGLAAASHFEPILHRAPSALSQQARSIIGWSPTEGVGPRRPPAFLRGKICVQGRLFYGHTAFTYPQIPSFAPFGATLSPVSPPLLAAAGPLIGDKPLHQLSLPERKFSNQQGKPPHPRGRSRFWRVFGGGGIGYPPSAVPLPPLPVRVQDSGRRWFYGHLHAAPSTTSFTGPESLQHYYSGRSGFVKACPTNGP